MALTATTKLSGPVATDSTVATSCTLADAPYIIDLTINGSGAAAYSINGAANPATDPTVPAGTTLVICGRGGKGIGNILIYSNSSESGLTYNIGITKY